MEDIDLERVRREVQLGRGFNEADFERALRRFREMYQVFPERILCSPDVLERYCAVYECGDARAAQRALRHDGIPIAAAVIAPGTVAFEGEVDEDRMGDW